MPSAVAIIPARFASSRFPGKVLVPLLGRPLLHHVVDGVRRARRVDAVLVAVDDERVERAARQAGAEVVWTRRDHPSGTDRVAEAAAGLDCEVIVNVQGDEPMIHPETVDRLAGALLDSDEDGMATLWEPIEDPRDVFDPNVVKVVLDGSGRALFFSRSPLPYRCGPGGTRPADFLPHLAPGGLQDYRRHVGLYAYRREVLRELARTEPTPLERSESLEQLRALETGRAIRVLRAPHAAVGVDTPDDLARVESLMKGRPS